jgi:nitroreductase/dihydropteridine reductase
MGATPSFLNRLEWRRAVKHFGKGEVDTSCIQKAIVAAPSSFGLQPYKVYAVRNTELKSALQAVSFNQAQVSECDTLFVFCARTDVEARAEEYLKTTSSESLRQMLTGFLASRGDLTDWAARQAYIALGFAMAACMEEEISSCPMEGFMSSEVSKVLDLPSTLVPIAFLAVGEEAGPEATPYPRFRFAVDDLIVHRM